MAQQILTKKEAFTTNLHVDKGNALQEILRIGTSAGGARPKAIIAYNETTGEVRSGQMNAPVGFEHWLLKLDGVSDVQSGASHGYGRVEMAYYNMAQACGITMMPSRLMEENGRAHFMTKRFDREGGDIKHHVQTLCAIKHYDYSLITSFSYEQLFQTMRELNLTYPDMHQLFRRMVFNVAAHNCDDHTKNFSFLLRQNKKWELSPAYDICYAYDPNNLWVKQHILSINGKRKDITRADLMTIAKSSGIQKGEEIIDEIVKIEKQWEDFANHVSVEPKLRDAIASTLMEIE
jgi:serine/threonine-protein kinase HipA